MPVLREALAPTQAWPDVPTLTVENGIGAEETAAEIRGLAPLLAGSLTARSDWRPRTRSSGSAAAGSGWQRRTPRQSRSFVG